MIDDICQMNYEKALDDIEYLSIESFNTLELMGKALKQDYHKMKEYSVYHSRLCMHKQELIIESIALRKELNKIKYKNYNRVE